MSLLTPSESHAFQSFLSSVDDNSQIATEWTTYEQHNDAEVPVQGSEALVKATKDLMSLDADRWNSQQQTHYDYHNYPHQQQQQQYDHYYRPPPRPQRHVTFPFLAKQQHHPELPASSSTFSSYSPLPVRASASPTLADSQQQSFDSTSMPISKRSRPSPPAQPVAKPALLSPSQKKANHIQSEQKRRANIRRGYEALCETVPTLREAIRAEEEAARDAKGKGRRSRARAKADDATGEKIDGRAGPRSEHVVLMKSMHALAFTKLANIMIAIDYINDLLSERSQLLSRLDTARASLPPGHHALIPAPSQPLWEREWRGGEDRSETEPEEGEEDGE